MSRLAFGGGYGGGNELGYKFVPLPIIQADADEDSYVVDAVGAAGTNLTGAGGGLTGADLVLTQYNAVGTDGVNRVIADNSLQGFVGTYGLYNLAYNSPNGFTFVHRIKDLSLSQYHNRICNLWLGDEIAGDQFLYSVTPSDTAKMAASISTLLGAGICSAPGVVFPEAEQSYMIILSMDYQSGSCFAGIKIDDDVFPKSLGEFALFAINQLPKITPPVVGLNNCYTTVNGSPTFVLAGGRIAYYVANSGSYGHTLRHITVSKTPCLVPA